MWRYDNIYIYTYTYYIHEYDDIFISVYLSSMICPIEAPPRAVPMILTFTTAGGVTGIRPRLRWCTGCNDGVQPRWIGGGKSDQTLKYPIFGCFLFFFHEIPWVFWSELSSNPLNDIEW